MHQTFYIDSDEEISSVIDRLRRSMSQDNYFIVPKRAIFLQSIVNLKLLKREADKIEKNIILVTQDEIGISMASRIGIQTQAATEVIDNSYQEIQEFENKPLEELEKINLISKTVKDEKYLRLNGVGSTNFYDGNQAGEIYEKKQETYVSREKKSVRPKAINLKKATNVNNSLKYKENGVLYKEDSLYKIKKSQNQLGAGKNIEYVSAQRNGLDPQKEKVIEKIFLPLNNQSSNRVEGNNFNVKEGRKMKKIFIFFILICLILLAGVAAYLFIPSSKIIIELNVQKKKTDITIHAVNSDSSDVNNIPIRILNSNEKISLSYNSTGHSNLSGAKAHGSVVIYNAFSVEPQTLVATTRLSSGDGKIFRLVKTIVVPGMTIINGEVKPGAITADVLADQAGSEYNLEVTSFTIPGFSGSSKYDKFYAKSTDKFLGGFANGSASVAISKDDLETAKKKTEGVVSQKINDIINSQLEAGEILLPEAEKIAITSSQASAKIGDAVDNFDYEVIVSYSAIIFSENDIKDIIKKQTQSDQTLKNMTGEVTRIDYASANCDFVNNSLELKLHIDQTLTPQIDLDFLKAEILGKDEQELGIIIRKYSSIKNANIEFKPSIIPRVSQYPQKVKFEVMSNRQN